MGLRSQPVEPREARKSYYELDKKGISQIFLILGDRINLGSAILW